MKHFLICILCFFAFSSSANARALSLLEPNFAIEIGGSFNYFTSAYNAALPIDWTWQNTQEKMGFNGSLYLVANVHSKMALRAGVEVLVPRTLNDMHAVSASGVKMLDGNTSTYVVIPTAAWDMFYYSLDNFRAFIGAELGYAMLNVSNKWSFTDAGKAAGYVDYTEKFQSSVITVNPYAGIEVAAVDKYSIVVKAGYRVLSFKDISSTAFNFSGLNASLGFRLYF